MERAECRGFSRKNSGSRGEGGLGLTALGQTSDVTPRPRPGPQSPPSSQGVAKGAANVRTSGGTEGAAGVMRDTLK